MNKTILIVEDQIEQILIAKKAVVSFGFVPLVATNLIDATRLLEKMKHLLVGVVTDLYYPTHPDNNDSQINQINGLAIVALCIQNNIRVAICSDINHHHSNYVKILIEALEAISNRIPFTEDSKDWNYAVKELLTIK
jgi:CheY-like chemotaxis protein